MQGWTAPRGSCLCAGLLLVCQQAGTLISGRLHDAASTLQAQGSYCSNPSFQQLGQQLAKPWPLPAGFLVGRDIRAVEWDAANSPSLPDGRAVSFKLRALTPDGLRIALAKQYCLEGAKDIKQVRSSTEYAAPGLQLSKPKLTCTSHTMEIVDFSIAVVLSSGIMQ